MGDKSAIEWTEATWNPWQGCHKVSPGCKHCYMYREKKQYGQNPAVVIRSKPHTFSMPLRLKDPARVFTCSWSDFFIEEADGWRDEAWEIIRSTPHLTYQVLTKRPERMAGRLPWHRRLEHTAGVSFVTEDPWPNVWLGVSVEDQATADERIPLLLQTPAAVRWVSYEPALGPVDLSALDGGGGYRYNALCAGPPFGHYEGGTRVDWIVVGGESGPGARPFDLAWTRQTIEQGRAAGVPVFVKQLGGQPRGWCRWRSHRDSPPAWLDKDGVLPSISGQPAHDLCHAHEDSWWSCTWRLRDRKGGDPQEWPSDLRVREYPR